VIEPTWRRRLGRGAAAGAAGGITASLLLWLLVEPVIGRAVDIEESGVGGHTHGHDTGATAHEHAELVTRLQQQIGGTLTVIVVAVLLGIVFAVAYARVSHRLPGCTDLGRSLSLAALAFAVVALVPALVLPANPPGVGTSGTVDQRTLVYLTVILLGGIVVSAVFALNRTMLNRGVATELRWLASAAIVAAGFVIVLVGPHVEEQIPTEMPAALLWEFRVGSLAQLAGLWATIGLVHGFLVHRTRSRALQSRRGYVSA
jgi:predicted cobalt transporter CbtA